MIIRHVDEPKGHQPQGHNAEQQRVPPTKDPTRSTIPKAFSDSFPTFALYSPQMELVCTTCAHDKKKEEGASLKFRKEPSGCMF